MKFLHTGDLHIGKRIFETSMLEDQKHILDQICRIAQEEAVDAVLVAGDVYDRAVPSTEAVTLLDEFLTYFVQRKIPIIMISGNHDSPERVGFADRILDRQGLYIAGNYREPLKCVTLTDGYGPVTFVCMPFVKPAVAGAQDSASAVAKMLEETELPAGRKVLLTHFFVTGEHGEAPELSDSESGVSVGGLDSVPVSLFKVFDYVALGHIHKPQQVGGGNVYYAGAPLKYSFSEARGEKSVRIVELGAPGEVSVRKRALKPLHELRCIKGRLEALLSREALECPDADREDYIQATLTDTEELIDPMGALRSAYPNALQILLEKNQEQDGEEYGSRLSGERKSTAELFADFYEMLKGEPLDERRRALVEECAREAL